MSRIFNQKNVWGSQGGVNPQRADFWGVDFSQVINGLNDQIRPGATSKLAVTTDLVTLDFSVEPYYIASVSMPTLKVATETVRRDSRPYMMPGFDEPLPEIKVMFIMETPTDSTTSKIYRFMDTWRAFTRAGRGSMGGEKGVQQLNQNFRVNFRFPVTITLMRGNKSGKINNISSTFSQVSNEYYGDLDSFNRELAGLSEQEKNARLKSIISSAGLDVNAVENPLEDCAVFQLENVWLSGFKMTDLDYSKGNEIVKIEASFYADNIRDLVQQ